MEPKMKKQKETTKPVAQAEPKKKNPPSHIIFQVVGDEENSKWIRVGAAWPNKDGKGMRLFFDAYPVVGRTMLRENKFKDADSGMSEPAE
jgi:hypothetical protein